MNSLQYIIDRLTGQHLDPNDIASLSELETRDGFEIVDEEELDRLLEFSRQHPALKHIFPFLTDGNSNYISIYTDGPLKGLVCAWDHEEPEDAFDYPSREQ